MKRLALLAVVLAGCGDLKGLDGAAPPLAVYTIDVTGTPAEPPHHLEAAIVWGMQWLPEPLCILPPEDPAPAGDARATLAAGCRDPFGFVPLLVDEVTGVTPGVPATIDFGSLPTANVLVGDVTARVGYASVVVYDDLDDSGRLELARPNRLGVPEDGPGSEGGITMLHDRILGASFVSMTRPDQRVGYREGAFDAAAAFYPRAGCGDPPVSFSVLAASGFSSADALADALAGKLPMETDPSQCVQAPPEQAPITVALQPPTQPLAEVACTEHNADSSVRYREPPTDAPDFLANPAIDPRSWACVHLPSFGGGAPKPIELIVSGNPMDSCVGLTHYVLKGCREDPNCAVPDWDHSLAPPSWWPCPAS